jgi:hypothetical protein
LVSKNEVKKIAESQDRKQLLVNTIDRRVSRVPSLSL